MLSGRKPWRWRAAPTVCLYLHLSWMYPLCYRRPDLLSLLTFSTHLFRGLPRYLLVVHRVVKARFCSRFSGMRATCPAHWSRLLFRCWIMIGRIVSSCVLQLLRTLRTPPSWIGLHVLHMTFLSKAISSSRAIPALVRTRYIPSGNATVSQYRKNL